MTNRVAVVTDELVGINRGGGIGTCANGLIRVLISKGFDVDVIITDPSFRSVSSSFYGAKVRSLAIWLDKRKYNPVDHVVYAYGVYEMLREEVYHSVHFNDWRGSGYFYAMARRQGIVDTLVVSHTHGPTKWVRHYNHAFADIDMSEVDILERVQLENSDHVVSPSSYLLDWYRSQGANLRSTHVINWILPEWLDFGIEFYSRPLRTKAVPPNSVNELIFFGRHERRKGFDLFLAAIKSEPRLHDIDLTFVGRFDRIDREFTGSKALRLLSAHGGSITFLNDLDHKAAFSLLIKKSNALVVMPSLIENSPCTVGECFTVGIPFLATAVGGTPELIVGGSESIAMVTDEPKALAARLVEVINVGMPEIQSRLDPKIIMGKWTEFLDRLVDPPPRCVSIKSSLVSVCLVHHNRPVMLRRALSALAQQTYKEFEVVLVDDGSDEATLRQLDAIETEDRTFPLRVIRSKNNYLGAARNLAAKDARGEYLIFHDDDNVSEPDQIAKFVYSIQKGQYDILTSQYFVFHDWERPEDGKIMYFPMGAGGPFSYFRNRFGDANAIVRKSAFESLGGFSELKGIGWEDWEFFLRAYMAGMKMGIVPDPLFRYRASTNGMLASTSPVGNHARIIAATAAASPPATADLLEFAKSESIGQHVLDYTWSNLGQAKFSGLHHELMALDPNSEDARYKLMELAFAMDRNGDAIEIGLGLKHGFHQVVSLLSVMGPRSRFSSKAVHVLGRITVRAEPAMMIRGWVEPTDTRSMIPDAIIRSGAVFSIMQWASEMRNDVNVHLSMKDDVPRGFHAVALAQSVLSEGDRSPFSLHRGTRSERSTSLVLSGVESGIELEIPESGSRLKPESGYVDLLDLGHLYDVTPPVDAVLCYNRLTVTTEPGLQLYIIRGTTADFEVVRADEMGVCNLEISRAGLNQIYAVDVEPLQIFAAGKQANLSATYHIRR